MKKPRWNTIVYRPRKVILKGKYYCPVVPELGHYPNEGMWGYDKLIHIGPYRYKCVQCLFKTEQERDAAYEKDEQNLFALGSKLLSKRTVSASQYEKEIQELEIRCEDTSLAHKITEGMVRVIM